MSKNTEKDVKVVLEELGIEVHVSRWLNGNSKPLVRDVVRYTTSLDKLLGRELREEVFNHVAINEPLKIKGDGAQGFMYGMFGGVPVIFETSISVEDYISKIEDKKMTLNLPEKSCQIKHRDSSHEVAHQIYMRMDPRYGIIFDEQYQCLKSRFIRSVMQGHKPDKVATGIHSMEMFLSAITEIPTFACWPGFVGNVDAPWESDYKEKFHKQKVLHVKDVFRLYTESEEGFCEFFAHYYEFDRQERLLFPDPRYKNKMLKDFGDRYMKDIINSATKEARQERKANIEEWLVYEEQKKKTE